MYSSTLFSFRNVCIFCTLYTTLLAAGDHEQDGTGRASVLTPVWSGPIWSAHRARWRLRQSFPERDGWAAAKCPRDAVCLPFRPTDMLTHGRRVGFELGRSCSISRRDSPESALPFSQRRPPLKPAERNHSPRESWPRGSGPPSSRVQLVSGGIQSRGMRVSGVSVPNGLVACFYFLCSVINICLLNDGRPGVRVPVFKQARRKARIIKLCCAGLSV